MDKVGIILMIYLIILRILELFLSKHNTEKLIKDGAKEFYPFHYKFIVVFHSIFLAFFLIKSFGDNNINVKFLLFFCILQFLRFKILYDLGKFWTTRIIVIDKPLINTWIFRTFRHPNYIIVFLEVVTICLIFNDIVSLFSFSLINIVLIFIRIYYEEKANNFRRKINNKV